MKLYPRFSSGYSSLWGIFSAVLLLLIDESLSDSGICTRSETVEKTRSEYVYQTYKESYEDWCRRSYSRLCTYYRTVGRNVPKYKTYEETVTKQFCCSGYKSTGGDGGSLRCEPICNFPCVNGKCAAFDQCECNQGYSKKIGIEADNICEPVCSQPCIHGTCTAPETCSCRHNYSLDPSDRYTCRPVCVTPCVNAECTAPNTCTCTAGYLKVLDDPYNCHPRCSKPCFHAVCTQPEVCTCHLGYQKDGNSSTSCSPVCSHPCQNGTCTGPDECTCFDGFELVGNYHTCEPVCTRCSNALCSAPETCSCFDGYRLDPNDTSTCLPICYRKCVHGNCTAPNSCECLDGFEETEDPAVCKPYCSDGCQNGVCTSPDECTCLWGFEKTDNSSICSPSKGLSHSCAFSNNLVNNKFDKSCFNLSGDLKLKEIKDCRILQELFAKHADKLINNSFHINLNCNPVLEVRSTKSEFYVEVICDITILDDEEEGRSNQAVKINEFSTTDVSERSSEFDFTDVATAMLEESINNNYPNFYEEMTHNYITISPTDFEETIDVLIVTTDELITTTKGVEQKKKEKSIIVQNEFEMLHDNPGETSTKVHLSKAPLNLNITAMFLPYIRNKLLTKTYFERNASLPDQEWCLCHQESIWTLCADQPIKLYICPCRAKTTGSSLKDDSSTVTLRVLLLAAMVILLVTLAVLHATNRLKHIGSYSTRTLEEGENSGFQSRLSLQSINDSE